MKAATLRVSPNFGLPLDTVTSTLIVYGGKGMGKTNLLSVVLEEMSKADLRWCAIDPVGVLYGLRHAADGRGEGVPCLILGGVHGDIPIEPTGGGVVADLVADEDVNVNVDCSRNAAGQMWSVGERTRFIADFALRLFQRQGSLVDGMRREPIFLALDEAARYIPQVIPHGNPDLSKCLGAWEQLVEEGRNVGIGVGLFTQRSARLNKSVAELADAMIAFRTVGPRSIEAVMDWLGEHVPKAHVRDLIEIVRQIPVGNALVVSPGWLRFEGVVAMRARETFDSSATPKPGERVKRIRGAGAIVDLAAYQARMAETIERAKAEDPKELRKTIASQQREMARLEREGHISAAAPVEIQVPVEVSVLTDEDRALITRLNDTMSEHAGFWAETVHQISNLMDRVRTQVPHSEAHRGTVRHTVAQNRSGLPTSEAVADLAPKIRESVQRATATPVADPDSELSKAHRALLSVLAVHGTRTDKQLGVLSGYSHTSGHFKNTLANLRSRGLAEGSRSGISITDAGLTLLGPVDPLPQGQALLEFWYGAGDSFGKLDKAQALLLRALVAAWPKPLSDEDLEGQTGYAHTSGHFKNSLARIRSLELAAGRRDAIYACETLGHAKSG